jgi:arylsulfatase A-like enzyme
MRKLRDAGKLTPAQMSVFTTPRPREELYDTQADSFELHNLADDPAHKETLERLRQTLAEWERETDDAVPEQRRPDEYNRETGERLHRRGTP